MRIGQMRYVIFLLIVFVSCTSQDKTLDGKPLAPNAHVDEGSATSAAPLQADKSDQKTAELTPKEQQAWRKRLPIPANCSEYDPDDPDSVGARILRLNDRQTVVDARCMLGSYQESHLIFLWDATNRKGERLNFPVYQRRPSAKTTTETELDQLWGQTEFDSSAKQLKVFSRFRQTGDCGWWALYSFPSAAVKLVEFHLKSECDGKDPMNPQGWPSVTVR
jgi:Protein of unknown function (DUF1176)